MGLLAIVVGGPFAMATAVAGADPDVNDMEASGTDASGNKNMAGQDLSGTAASATQLRAGGITDEEYDPIIAKFRPFLFPLDTDIRLEAEQQHVKGYEVQHVQSGSSALDCVTTAAISKAATISLTSSNVSGKLSMFPVDATILVQGVMGYAPGSSSVTEGTLMLIVTANTGSAVTCAPLNGITESGTEKVPAIPSGTTLSVCAPACSESQMIVAPDNYQPRPKNVYLQKKIFNIVITDKFAQQVKKFPFFETDIKENALYNFRRKSARSAWVGIQRKFVKTDAEMGEEYVYTQEGILRQLTMLVGLGDEFQYKYLTMINMLMFTENANGNTARAYCGRNFIKKLLGMAQNKTYKEIGFKSYDKLGVKVNAYEDNFGTVEYVYDPTLDDIGYSEFAVVVDIKHARRYVETESREFDIDMKRGAGTNHEAKRHVTIIADAIALKGYNSILVGPSSLIGTANLSDSAVNVEYVNNFPETASEGDLIYLGTAQTIGDDTYAVGAYQYTSGAWATYSGTVAII